MSFPQTFRYPAMAANSRQSHVLRFSVVTTGAQTVTAPNNIIASGGKLVINWGDGTVEVYTGNGSNMTLTHNYSGAGTFSCSASGDLAAWQRFYFTDTKLRVSFEEVAKIPALTSAIISSPTIIDGGGYSINHFEKYPALNAIQLTDPDIVGNVDFLGSRPIGYLYLTGDMKATGSISSFTARTNMTTFLLQGNFFTGDLEELPDSQATLSTLMVDGNLFTGDLADISAYTAVTNLTVRGPLFTGDFASINPLTALTNLLIVEFSGTFTDGPVPALNNCTESVQIALTSTMVDNLLNRRAAAGKTGGTCNYAGTNGARTAASDAAVATLTGAGVTVTTN